MLQKKNDEIPSHVFARIVRIFNNNSWEIEHGGNEFSAFNRFCTMIAELNEEQQELVLELTKRYTRIEVNDYILYLKNLLRKFANENATNLIGINKIYIAPLIAPEDIGKSKSSTTVQYLLRNIICNTPILAEKKSIYVDGLQIESDQINDEDSLLILVDDFIGTGETAESAVKFLIDKGIRKEKIVILTIAALQIGEDFLRESNILLYTHLTFNKGITDNYTEEELSEKLMLMNTIESKIKVHKNEKLGFKGSEALISLIRTPNNTFPVFWKERKGRKAPFPR